MTHNCFIKLCIFSFKKGEGYLWGFHQKLPEELINSEELNNSYKHEDGKRYCFLVSTSMGKLKAKKCDDDDDKEYFICEKGEY